MSFGYHFTTWTLPRFTEHLKDYKVVNSISIEKVRQILDEFGARLKRSKRWQYSPDKDFDKKKLAIEQAIAVLPPNGVFQSVRELMQASEAFIEKELCSS